MSIVEGDLPADREALERRVAAQERELEELRARLAAWEARYDATPKRPPNRSGAEATEHAQRAKHRRTTEPAQRAKRPQEKQPVSKLKLALGAASLFLFIVGLKRTFQMDEADPETAGQPEQTARPGEAGAAGTSGEAGGPA